MLQLVSDVGLKKFNYRYAYDYENGWTIKADSRDLRQRQSDNDDRN